MNASKSLVIATVASMAFSAILRAETWDGSDDTNWFDTDNWASNTVPTSSTSALVNLASGNMPVIDGGNAAALDIVVGQSPTANSSLTIQNSGTLTTTAESYIGGIFNASTTGTGHVTITGTGSKWTSTAIRMGLQSASSGNTLDVLDGALLSSSSFLVVGQDGKATVTVSGGADVTGLTTLTLGNGAGSVGVASISGIGSTMGVGSTISIGSSGTGTLNVQAGAAVTSSGNVTLGSSANGRGALNITGTSSQFNSSGDLSLGLSGRATLTLSDSAAATFSTFLLGQNAGSTGNILSILSGATMNLTGIGTSSVGGGGGADEVIVNSGTLTTSGAFSLGNSSGSDSKLTISNGGRVSTGTAGLFAIASSGGSKGSVTVTGTDSRLIVNQLRVGNSGTGTLTVAEGAIVTVGSGSGTITISQAIGSSGTLTIGNGGSAGVIEAAGFFSDKANANLVLNHNEASYNLNPRIQGTVALTVNGTGTTVLNSTSANDHTGGTTINSGALKIKVGANNWLASTGTITVNGGSFDLGNNLQSLTTGGLVISGGTVSNGTVSKNTGNYDARSGSVSAVLGGVAGLIKTTSGTLSLSGSNTYSGATVVNAGTLLVAATGTVAAASNVTVNGGGTLGGTGTILGNVTLDGGTLSPGLSPGTLTIDGNLTLNSGITLIELDSPTVFDSIVGINAITYGGVLQIDVAEGLSSGVFELFNFTSRIGSSEFSAITFSGDYSGTFNYSTGELSLVPEPTVVGLIGMASVFWIGACRMRRQRRLILTTVKEPQ